MAHGIARIAIHPQGGALALECHRGADEDQIGGQFNAGFVLTGCYQDRDPKHPLAQYIPAFLATRALKSSHA